MRSVFSKTFLGSVLLSLLPFTAGVGQTSTPTELPRSGARTLPVEPAAKLLLDRFGIFRAAGAPATPKPEVMTSFGNDLGGNLASRPYISNDGQRFWLTIVKTGSDSVAYSLLTQAKASLEMPGSPSGEKAGVGVESFLFPGRLIFVKGPALAVVNPDGARTGESQSLVDIAKAVADTLDKGQGDIPVLVKHLPDWQHVQRRILYAVKESSLKNAISNQRVLEAVSFDGGAEAVIANYDTQRLVVVEFNTPQLATENDRRIMARIQELQNQGQPVPTAYRRVGNYSVFVFDAPSELAANQLIDQVKYQQVVQWLGKNPYAYREAVAEFTQTTLGVLVSVVKASGLVILGSLAVGGFLGALLFTRRRSQQQGNEAYSDAGGMLRLNLDEMNSKTDPARLGPGTSRL